MLETVFGVCSKRTDCSQRPSFFKSFGDVCLDPGSVYLKREGLFFSWRPLGSDTGQGLVFEGSLMLLVPGCCSLVENLAFQSIWDFCFAKKPPSIGKKRSLSFNCEQRRLVVYVQEPPEIP